MTSKAPRVVVLGLGNSDRSDDAAGLLVARRVSEGPRIGAEIRELPADASEILEAWEGADAAVVVDAMRSGLPPGSVRRIDASRESLAPGEFRGASTHAFGVGEAIELARVLGRLPERLVVVGVEGARWDPGGRPTPEVEAAVESAAKIVREEVERCTSTLS